MELKHQSGVTAGHLLESLNRTFYGIETFDLKDNSSGVTVLIVRLRRAARM